MAAHKYCSQDSIIITMDAIDELIGKNVFKVYNAAYRKGHFGVLYSNFYWY